MSRWGTQETRDGCVNFRIFQADQRTQFLTQEIICATFHPKIGKPFLVPKMWSRLFYPTSYDSCFAPILIFSGAAAVSMTSDNLEELEQWQNSIHLE